MLVQPLRPDGWLAGMDGGSGKVKRTGTWKATRTSFQNDETNVDAGRLSKSKTGGGASLTAKRPDWNPQLVRDVDRLSIHFKPHSMQTKSDAFLKIHIVCEDV